MKARPNSWSHVAQFRTSETLFIESQLSFRLALDPSGNLWRFLPLASVIQIGCKSHNLLRIPLAAVFNCVLDAILGISQQPSIAEEIVSDCHSAPFSCANLSNVYRPASIRIWHVFFVQGIPWLNRNWRISKAQTLSIRLSLSYGPIFAALVEKFSMVCNCYAHPCFIAYSRHSSWEYLTALLHVFLSHSNWFSWMNRSSSRFPLRAAKADTLALHW